MSADYVLTSGDLAQIRSLLLSAADEIDGGWHSADLSTRLRTAADDLLTPEDRARRDAMKARLRAIRDAEVSS